MKDDNHKTIAFKEREEHHISKYRFKSNKNGNIDFKVIPYPKYKILRKGRKLIKLKKIYIALLIILVACAYFFITNKRLSNLIDKKESANIYLFDNNKFYNNTEYIKNEGYFI